MYLIDTNIFLEILLSQENLKIGTMDKDFEKAKYKIDVIFL